MGEFELLARLRERLPAAAEQVLLGSGDDAAITVPAGAVATSVDALVEGVHFRRSTTTLEEIGAKALASALSDLAAMGARAGEAYVALGVPGDLDEDGCLRVLDGLVSVARETGVTLAGGDVTASPVLFCAVTVVGHAPGPGSLVSRAGAKAGDLLILTGELGGAAAGLALLEDPSLAAAVPPALAEALRERQRAPKARLAAGLALAAAKATAMIDVSDGLAADAGHLARASGVGLVIDAAAVPVAPGVSEVARAGGRDPPELVLGGGEDYELLATLGSAAAEAALTALEAAGAPGSVIGEVGDGEGVEIRRAGCDPRRIAGYDHLSR